MDRPERRPRAAVPCGSRCRPFVFAQPPASQAPQSRAGSSLGGTGCVDDLRRMGPVVAGEVTPTRILLSGSSSTGKSTLARAVQDVMPAPWVVAPADAVRAGFPSHRPEFATLEWDHRLREACVRAALGLIGAGLSVILEQGLRDSWGQAIAARLLSRARFFVVGVIRGLGVAESREAARLGRVTGLARKQREEVLASGMPADLIVDSTRHGPAELATRISQWLAEGPLARSATFHNRWPVGGEAPTPEVAGCPLAGLLDEGELPRLRGDQPQGRLALGVEVGTRCRGIAGRWLDLAGASLPADQSGQPVLPGRPGGRQRPARVLVQVDDQRPAAAGVAS